MCHHLYRSTTDDELQQRVAAFESKPLPEGLLIRDGERRTAASTPVPLVVTWNKAEGGPAPQAFEEMYMALRKSVASNIDDRRQTRGRKQEKRLGKRPHRCVQYNDQLPHIQSHTHHAEWRVKTEYCVLECRRAVEYAGWGDNSR